MAAEHWSPQRPQAEVVPSGFTSRAVNIYVLFVIYHILLIFVPFKTASTCRVEVLSSVSKGKKA